MSRLRRRLLASTAAAALVAATPAGADWSTPRFVAPGTSQPTLLMDSRGDSLLVARSPSPYATSTLNVLRSRPNRPLGPIDRLGVGGSLSPVAAVGPKLDLLAWQDRQAPAVFALATAPGRRFAAPRPLPPVAGGQAGGAGVAVDASGRGLVVWDVDYPHGIDKVFAAWRRPGGRALGAPQLLYTSPSVATAPLVALSGRDHFVVAFLAAPPGGTYSDAQMWTTSAAVNGRFAAPRPLSPATLHAQEPVALATDTRDRRALVAWAETPATGSRVTVTLTAVLAGATGRFGRRGAVGAFSYVPTPGLAVAISPSGRAVVAYATGDHVLRGALATGGRRFGGPVKLADMPAGSIVSPAAAFDSRGGGVVAWAEDRSDPSTRGPSSIEAKLWPVGAVRLCPARRVARGMGLGATALAADDHGHVSLAFVDTTTSAVDLAHYTPTAQRPPGRCSGA